MAKKFLRYDGTNWTLDQGLVGPPGLPGADGANGDATLIYQPGGAATGNVFTSWTSLMSRRFSILGPITIVIDDSIISPAPVDVGTWDFGGNTKLVGKTNTASNPYQAVLDVGANVSIQNPSEFENLIVRVSKWSATVPSVHFTGTPTSSLLVLKDAIIKGGTNALGGGIPVSFGAATANTLKLYGKSRLDTDDNFSPISVDSGTSLIVEMYDSSNTSDSIFFGAGTTIIRVYDDGVQLDDRQGTSTINYFTNSPLIFGGTGKSRTFTTWTRLMQARSTIPGPVTIIIDDSQTSPLLVDVGSWDLTRNTSIVGYKSNETDLFSLPQLRIQDGAQLLNPCYFENVFIQGANVGSGLPSITASGIGVNNQTLDFTAINVLFNNNGAGQALIKTSGGTINLYGSSRILSPADATGTIQNAGSGEIDINLYDSAVIDGYSLNFTNAGSGTINITIIGANASYGSFQPLVSASGFNVYGTNFDPVGFAGADTLSVPQKIGVGQITWAPVAVPQIAAFSGQLAANTDGYQTLLTVTQDQSTGAFYDVTIIGRTNNGDVHARKFLVSYFRQGSSPIIIGTETQLYNQFTAFAGPINLIFVPVGNDLQVRVSRLTGTLTFFNCTVIQTVAP